ncbi:hypothetical protein E2562_027785 [Oryza meyeriana var. granulata]|uniref:Uncharacterized protein n=1 Tax=Oryza meyeriana var. granulata TaxID=110450 RepID=A0A6G1EBS3_9ORYZ|nr:hypothetical protein E2562_027785 [Oryza meyeriana var. granulata]
MVTAAKRTHGSSVWARARRFFRCVGPNQPNHHVVHTRMASPCMVLKEKTTRVDVWCNDGDSNPNLKCGNTRGGASLCCSLTAASSR